MLKISTVKELRFHLDKARNRGEKIGIVPTMGALHNGHMHLIQAAAKDCDVVVASIFVNPTQFNEKGDFDNYPKTLDRDLQLLSENNCDVAFVPPVEEMYSTEPTLTINFGSLETELEGKFRPGHFRGVGLVVSKLFNIAEPDFAYFGQKDLQQFYVIQALIDQLSYKTTLRKVATAREKNGLAMSSRNLRLSNKQREEAGLIFRSLIHARNNLNLHKDINAVKSDLRKAFEGSDQLELEYFEVISTDTFAPLTKIEDTKRTALCIAAFIGGVRLIDNLMLID